MARFRSTLKFTLIGGLIVSIALTASALTLGRVQGAAWIGQPLELVIPLQLDQESTEGGLCPQADIFDGDSRQDPSQVRTTAEISSQNDVAKIKIVSTVPVDEPVVTVYLRVGCAQKIAKRFVLLAEYRGTPSAPTTAPTPPATQLVAPISIATGSDSAPVAAPSPPPQSAASAAGQASATTSANSKPSKTPASRPAPTVKPHATSATNDKANDKTNDRATEPRPQSSAPRVANKPATSGRPHLELDPAEKTLSKPQSAANAATPTASAAQVAQPAAPAPTASEAVRPTPEEQVKTLQQDMQRLMEQANTNQAALLAMRQRLEDERSAQLPVTILYVLLARVVLCLGVLAFAWLRHNALMARQLRDQEPDQDLG